MKRYSITQAGEKWVVTDETGQVYGHADGFDTYQLALAEVGSRTLAEGSAAGDGDDPDPAGKFRSELIPEGKETSDGRLIEQGACSWRTPPLPLMLQTKTEIGHFGAELCGSFTEVTRVGNMVVIEGTFDDSEAGRQAVQILNDRERFGISADIGEMDADFECTEEDEDGWCIDGLLTVHKAEIMGATMTPFPAFAEAFIELTQAGSLPDADSEAASAGRAGSEPLVAAAAPVAPPAEWFIDPQLAEPTPMTVTDDGRVYGHAALWGSCHVGRDDVCLTPPQSAAEYAYFRTGEVKPDDCACDAIPTGTITLATGHASLQLAHAAAFEHYANSGHAVADVACGEDAHGIWFSGALRPTVSDEQIRELRGSAISGDWRRVGGNLELIAMLAVNTPGYPVPRAKARVASGAEVALVAAGSSPLAMEKADPEAQWRKQVEARLSKIERVAEPLRGAAAAAYADQIAASAAPTSR